MRLALFLLLLPCIAALPIGTSFKALIPKAPAMPEVVEKHIVSPLDRAWSSLIHNAKAAKYVLKAEVKEHFIEKPLDEWQALWADRRESVSTEFADPAEYEGHYSEESGSDSEEEVSEMALPVVKKTLPAHLRANLRDFSYQPYVRNARPEPKLIYEKRNLVTEEGWVF